MVFFYRTLSRNRITEIREIKNFGQFMNRSGSCGSLINYNQAFMRAETLISYQQLKVKVRFRLLRHIAQKLKLRMYLLLHLKEELLQILSTGFSVVLKHSDF